MKQNKDLNAYINPDTDPKKMSSVSYEDVFGVKKDREIDSITIDDVKNSEDNPFATNIETQAVGDFKDSMFLDRWDDPRDSFEIEEKLAERQPWISKAASGVGRVGLKVGAEIAKMPGYFGGAAFGAAMNLQDLISGEDKNDFVKIAFDNAWVNAVADIEENIKEEALPVYVSNAVKHGNIWDNITSVDFWATEGADGLGFLLSMLVPGAAINKFALGSKLFRGIKGASKMFDKVEETATFLNKAGITPKSADLLTGTVANTWFEAASEANSAIKSYEDELNMRASLHPSDPEYLSQEQLEIELAKSSNIGRNVFLANSAILLGPNMVMSKILWGKNLNTGKRILTNKEGRFDLLKGLTGKQMAGKIGKSAGMSILREGAFEEGMQSVAETYYTENPDAKPLDILDDIVTSYVDMASSTEGQKAMFLGAVFAGTMTSIQTYKTEKAKVDNSNKLITAANEVLSDFDSFIDTDARLKADGSIETNEDGTVKDPNKVIEKAKGLQTIMALGEMYDKAVEEKDTETINNLRELMTTNLIKPFIVNETLGIDALKSYLENSDKILEQSKKEKFDRAEYIKDILDKAEFMKNSFETFMNFGSVYSELNNKEANEVDKISHYRKLALNYVNNKTLERYWSKKLKEANSKLDKLNSEYETNILRNREGDIQVQELEKSDSRFAQVRSEISNYEKYLKEIYKTNSDFWNKEKINKNFDSEMKKVTKIREQEKELKEIDDVFAKIKSAKSEKDLSNIKIPDSEAGKISEPSIKAEIEKKRAEIRKEKLSKEELKKQTAEEEKKKKEEEAAKKEEAIKKLKENFNVGEKVRIPKDVIPESMRNEDETSGYKITKITDSSVTLENDKGKSFSMSALSIAEKASFLEDTSSTEGGDSSTKQDSVPNVVSKKAMEGFDTRILSQNDKSGKDNQVLRFTNDRLMAFERSPFDKTGKPYNVKVNDFRKSETVNQSTEDKKDEIEKKRQEFPENQSNTRTLITQKLLDYFADVNKLPKFTEDLTKGTYVSWLQNNGELGYKVSELLNAPQKAFDLIAKYDSELKALEINQKQIVTKKGSTENINSDKALEAYDNGDFRDLELLINYLPISVAFAEGIEGPLDTLRDGNKDLFKESVRPLREAIVKELANGTPMESITVEIAGQWNGEIQLDNKENNVADLYDFQGDVNNISVDDLYVAEGNVVKNNKGDVLPTGRAVADGEIYIKIKTAAGRDFPLKLNVSMVNENEAEVIYELVKYRFNKRFDENNKVVKDDTSENDPISEIDNLVEKIDSSMPQLRELFKSDGKILEDVTVKELMSFLVYGSINPKSRMRFDSKDPFFLSGTKKFNKKDINDNKEGFISHVTSFKRRHIKRKRTKYDSNNLNLDNKNYLDYLIKNNILTTNAVVGKENHTFAGRTTMYIDTTSVKVNGIPSNFIVEKVFKDNDNFIGVDSELKAILPSLFAKKLVQSSDLSKYVDEETGEESDRVSSLKPKMDEKLAESELMYNAAKRGSFIDDLFREYFSTKDKGLKNFLIYAETSLAKINKNKPDTDLIIEEDVIESIYNILKQYRVLFNELNYTVYPQELVVHGELGTKGKVAGTMDLLVYDNNNKKWRILDLKTSSVDRRDVYNQKNPRYKYKNNDSIQLNAYRELFKQMTGYEADVHMIPITLKPDDRDLGDYYSLFAEQILEDQNMPEAIKGVERKRRNLILDVEKKSIYSILRISSSNKKPETKKAPVKKKVITKKESVKEGVKKDSKITSKNTKFDIREAMTDFISDPDPMFFTYDGVPYIITNPVASEEGGLIGGLYIQNNESNEMVQDVSLAIDILNSYLNQNKEKGNFTKKNVEKLWKSRGNVVSLQDNKKPTKKVTKKVTKKIEEVENSGTESSFLKMLKNIKDPAEAKSLSTAMLSTLDMTDMPLYMDVMQEMSDRKGGVISAMDQMLFTYDFLIQKGEKEKDIQERCK